MVLPMEAADVQVEDVAGVVKLLGETINGVRSGKMDSKIGSTTGYLASILLRALEGSELAKQIEEQADALAALKGEMETIKRERRHIQASAGPAANGDRGAARGNGQQPHGGGDSGGRSGDFPAGEDDAGFVADDVAPFFQ
ncbi:MAG TPA: hypothetical protein VMG10_27415 [Gemmataceae bacterium]|nr:hypothetical protein [Gemmataceae bacterium]